MYMCWPAMTDAEVQLDYGTGGTWYLVAPNLTVEMLLGTDV